MSEIAQSITPPLYLRRVELVEMPVLAKPDHTTWPKYAVIVQVESSSLSTDCKQWLTKHGVQTHTLTLGKQPEKSIKKLLSWLEQSLAVQANQTISVTKRQLLLVDLLALSSGWNKQTPEDAALALSTQRLRWIQALFPYASQMRGLVWTQMGTQAFVKPSSPPAVNPAVPQPPADLAHRLLLGGASFGLFKSLAREWHMPCRCVDVAETLGSQSVEQILSNELSDTSDVMEVLYQGTTRFTPIPGEEPAIIQIAGSIISDSSRIPVMVISGGGLGITARIVEALAKHVPLRILLLGRTKLPDRANMLPLSDKAQTRRILREQLHKDATPKQLQEALQLAEKQAHLQQQIERFESLGIECLYVPTDMSDADSVQHAVQQAVTRWGRVDAVLHGAGIDQSRDVMQKTPDEMTQVMGVKIRGLAHLRQALQDQPVRTWMGLSSVSARFGNTGQTDYAAANEAMTRWLLGDSQFSHALVLDYTGWEDVGMAASLARFMKERGVDMLPVDLAASHTAALWLAGVTGEWLYAGRLPSQLDSQHPLGQIALRIPGREVRYQKTLHTGQDQLLQDHKMGDTEVQPGVVSLAWMQHCAEEVSQGIPCCEIQHVSFLRALKIFPKHPVIREVQAQRTDQTSPPTIQARVDSQRTRRGLSEHIHHASAVFLPGSCTVIPDFAEELKKLQETDFAEDLSLHTIYNTFFHGPTWQVLGRAWWNDTICIASLPTLTDKLGQGLPEQRRGHAVAQELALQAAGLWSLRQHGTFVLPFSLQRIGLFATPDLEEPCQARLRFLHRDGDDFVFQGILLGHQGQLLQTLDGLIMRRFPV